MEDVEEDVFRLSADDIELVQVDDASKDGEEDEEGKGPAEKISTYILSFFGI